MEAALESLKTLKPGEKPNYAQVAKKYGVNQNTLSRHHRGVQGTRTEKIENSRLLSPIQESTLVGYIDGLCAKGLPPTR
ncbi:hypothetical protein CC80DRAFT_365179, partial [Byssothecium circinans]